MGGVVVETGLEKVVQGVKSQGKVVKRTEGGGAGGIGGGRGGMMWGVGMGRGR